MCSFYFIRTSYFHHALHKALNVFLFLSYALKIMLAYEHRMLVSVIKKQTPVCCSISLNPYYGTSNLESRIQKKKAILLLA